MIESRSESSDEPITVRWGRRIGMTDGQVWTVGVLAVTIVLLLSSLRGLS